MDKLILTCEICYDEVDEYNYVLVDTDVICCQECYEKARNKV